MLYLKSNIYDFSIEQKIIWILGIILPIYLTSVIFHILTEFDDDVDLQLPCIIMRDTIALATMNLHGLPLGAVFRYTSIYVLALSFI